jgi:hypothetical protein
LRRGLLREFRDGSHRLLRTADVGAILAARTRQLERRGQTLPPSDTRPPSPRQDGGSASGRDGVRLPRAPDAASQTASRDAARSRAMGEQRGPMAGPSVRRPMSARPSRLPSRSNGLRASRGRIQPEALPPRQSLSVREWFWTGLIQDSPLAIALLAGLILLGLSAVIGGACMLAGVL